MESFVSILVLGSTYALLAGGIVIVYKASRVVNFAVGELAIVGAYVFYSADMMWFGQSLVLTIAVTAVVSVLFGVGVYLALMRPLIGQPTFVAAMVTIGLAIILKAGIVVIWHSRSVGLNFGHTTIYTYPTGGNLRVIDVVTIACGIAFFTVLFLFFRYAPLGRQFRGVAENPLLASQRQVNVNLILALAWGAGVFSAVLAGVLFGARSLLSPQSTIIGLSGLTAAMVGGLDSLRGAVVGGLLVAAATYATARLIDPVISDAVPFVILLAVMLRNPWGIFGTHEELNRV